MPYIKASGVNRLELWDYMTARVLERPLLGWGLSSAGAVPISPAELAGYSFVMGPGTYPHNQWLELWIETGALGAMAGLLFASVVLRRIWRMPAPLRPFAYAAFTSAITGVACINFQVTTDSAVGGAYRQRLPFHDGRPHLTRDRAALCRGMSAICRHSIVCSVSAAWRSRWCCSLRWARLRPRGAACPKFSLPLVGVWPAWF